ncbi:MAG: hypothetical protein JSR73_09715 [Proteobacteria bacterium]|nr:hypothetical protein [Pseudomonadota bacterium]
MDIPLWVRLGALALAMTGAYGERRDRPVAPRAGVLAPAEPEQLDLVAAPPQAPVAQGRWQLTARAHYDITARVLGRERYRLDALADLVPVDLALGWGPMSDDRVLGSLRIDQGARFYAVHWDAEPPLPPAEILRHSANLHAIPADRALADRLWHLRVGQVVRLTGELVDGAREDGAFLRTSLTREDTGAGACEVMRVETLEVR